jgi:hypothetical protein
MALSNIPSTSSGFRRGCDGEGGAAFGPDRGGDTIESLLLTGGEDNPGARGGGGAGDLLPDTAAGSGDDDDAIGEGEVCGHSRSLSGGAHQGLEE